MENFKFILFSIFIIIILSLGGYWAFSTIESGSSHVYNEKQKELEQKNEELTKEIASIKREVNALVTKKTEKSQVELKEKVISNSIPPTTTPTILKYQSLINELQKLADGSIYLKKKSQGLAVGSIQKFLNIYNNTSNRSDNDFGATTEKNVKNFQKKEKLAVDGEVGPGTLKRMISWLKNH